MKPFDDDLREQLQIPDLRENRGIEKAGGLGRDGGALPIVYMPDFGSGTARSSLSMI